MCTFDVASTPKAVTISASTSYSRRGAPNAGVAETASAVSASPAIGSTVPITATASFTTNGQLSGVAATSPRNAWAVGGTAGSNPKSIIVHWNGSSWKRVRSPRGYLVGVAATSARNAWAVGFDGTSTLILHWNGRSWKQVSSPGPAGSTFLGVAATSAGNAWAVGCSACANGPNKTLIMRWNGTSWRQARSPSPKGSDLLYGVAAVSARDAWAVGVAAGKTLIEYWNGTAWN